MTQYEKAMLSMMLAVILAAVLGVAMYITDLTVGGVLIILGLFAILAAIFVFSGRGGA